MEKENIKSLEAREIDSDELDKIAGGNVVRCNYSYNTYGLRDKVETKTVTGYYVPKNKKYYKSFEVASETDKELGGTGEISSTAEYTNCTPPSFSDIGWDQSE